MYIAQVLWGIGNKVGRKRCNFENILDFYNKIAYNVNYS